MLGGVEEQAKALKYADTYNRNRGVDTSEMWKNAQKSDPRIAAHNKAYVKTQSADDIAKHGSAEAAAIANTYARANISDIRNFSADALKDPAFAKNTTTRKIERASIEMSSAQALATKEGITSEGLRLRAARDKYAPTSAIYKEFDKKRNDLLEKHKAVQT